jgi:hypothetical protein
MVVEYAHKVTVGPNPSEVLSRVAQDRSCVLEEAMEGMQLGMILISTPHLEPARGQLLS